MMACWKRDLMLTSNMVTRLIAPPDSGRGTKENQLCSFAYAITNGGVTQQYVNENISVFNANAAVFVKNMEEKRPKP